MNNPIKPNSGDVPSGTTVTTFPLCRRHREELQALSEDGEVLKRSLVDLLAGAVVLERKNVVNLWVVKFVTRNRSISYRAKEAMINAVTDVEYDAAEWVTVNANTTLRHLINEYGERLLGYDSTREELTMELLSYDIVDSTVGSVRVLVRREAK